MQRKSAASSAASLGVCSLLIHGSNGEAKARKKHAAFLFPHDQSASGSGRKAGCLCSGSGNLPPEPARNIKWQQRRQENSSSSLHFVFLGQIIIDPTQERDQLYWSVGVSQWSKTVTGHSATSDLGILATKEFSKAWALGQLTGEVCE